MDKITLGEFIERQIKQRNLSGREFADLLDVPHSSVVRYRRHEPGNAHHTPSGEFMYKLAKATSTDIGYLWRLVYPDLPAPGVFSDQDALELGKLVMSLPEATRKLIIEFIFRR